MLKLCIVELNTNVEFTISGQLRNISHNIPEPIVGCKENIPIGS